MINAIEPRYEKKKPAEEKKRGEKREALPMEETIPWGRRRRIPHSRGAEEAFNIDEINDEEKGKLAVNRTIMGKKTKISFVFRPRKFMGE